MNSVNWEDFESDVYRGVWHTKPATDKKIVNEWKKSIQYLMENSYKISLLLEAPASISEDFYEGH